jgi:tetratricopeptide (TPR) repeat protein
VQLINAQTDSHLWADTYDRKLTNILGVESEIAKRIAESLQAKLTGREKQALAVKPTNNPDAYDAYLRGLAYDARAFNSGAGNSMNPEFAWKAIDFYERAVQLDPKFAIAWARLSREEATLYFNGNDTAPDARRDAAKRALENAQELAPNSPETLLALGYYQLSVLRDYGSAETTFESVSKILPGSSEALEALGKVARREGDWEESIAYFKQARALDPRNGQLLILAARTYGMVRQFPAALKLYDVALDIAPNDQELMAAKASIYQAQGSLQEAAPFLTQITAQTTSWFPLLIKSNQLRLERNYGEAVRFLQALHEAPYDGPVDKALGQGWIALAQRLAGDTAGAKATAELVRNTLEPLYRDQSENFSVLGTLSKAYAVMGKKDSALEVAERAIVLLPRAKDAVTGPSFEENLAVIQTLVGENSRAISTLTQLLQTPYDSWLYSPAPITPALLRLDPIWDPLRGDPAFQKLCQEKQK